MIGLLVSSFAAFPAGFSPTPTGGAEVLVSAAPVPPAADAARLSGCPRLYATTPSPAEACRRLTVRVEAAGGVVIGVQRLAGDVTVLVVRPGRCPAAAPHDHCLPGQAGQPLGPSLYWA